MRWFVSYYYCMVSTDPFHEFRNYCSKIIKEHPMAFLKRQTEELPHFSLLFYREISDEEFETYFKEGDYLCERLP